MIVAITGSSGTVGGKLVERHLEAGHLVRVLSRHGAGNVPDAVQAYRGDLGSDEADLANFARGADVLYHCAAEIRDPGKMVNVNVHGTRRLIEAARGTIGHWVQLSSIGVYGTPDRGIVTEQTPLNPIDVYGTSKADADRLVTEAAEQGLFTASILRPAKVFGARIDSENNRILHRMISLVDNGLFFFIGPAGALTHYVHIDNVIEALVRSAHADIVGSRVYNLSDDCTIEEFVAAIADELGRQAPTLRLPEVLVRVASRAFSRVPGFPLNERRISAIVNRASIPCDRIKRELSYRHVVSIEQGLRELVGSWKRRA